MCHENRTVSDHWTWQRKCIPKVEEVNMKKTMIAIASLLLLSSACWSDDMEVNANEAKYYDNAKVVRIKNVEGEGFVQRSYDEGREEATANLPLFEKDTVGTTDGRLAVYLGRMNYLRLDADSVAVLEKIPQLRKTDLNVRLEQGSLYLDVESLDQEKGIEIQTPDCGIFLLDKGMYRVNMDREGRTEVIVVEGTAEVAGRESSRTLRDNQEIVMERGEVGERPFYFNAQEKDDFDRWNEGQNREQGYARYNTSRYLQSGYEDYEYEMSRAGRWSYMSEFNSYGWTPYYANSDWRPYSNGRWVWNPYYGYVWSSYDNCGWFTHHYGRWNWSYNQGWCWLPSYHWSPAWVSWFGNDSYYGWSPLSWWNRPIIIVNNRWDRHYDYRRGIPRDSRSTIIIRKNELSAANINRVALNRSTLGRNTGEIISYRGTAPTDRPAFNKVTVINAEGKSVIYKQGGIVSGEKYRAQGSDIRNTVYKYDQPNRVDGTYRSYRKKGSDVSAVDSSRPAYRSRSGEATSSSSRTRYSSPGSSSSSSGEKSSGTTGFRSRSDGTAKASSSSSSTSSSSSGTIKKKKGGTSYFSSTRGENSTSGEAAAADSRYSSSSKAVDRNAGYSSPSSNFRSNSSGSYDAGSRSSYRATIPSTSYSRGNTNSSANGTYSPSTSSRSFGSSSSYRSGSYDAGSRSSYRATIPSTSYSRGNTNSSANGTYSPSTSSHKSSSSAVYRSGSSSSSGSSNHSSSSSSSSSSSGTAVKVKKH
jgi:hypothetical protein